MADWAKFTKKTSPPTPASKKSPLPQPDYNISEVLAFLSSSYAAQVAAAKEDKLGEKARVYRSLDASSAWSTKGPVKKEDRYSLLFEVNRSIHLQKKAKQANAN